MLLFTWMLLTVWQLLCICTVMFSLMILILTVQCNSCSFKYLCHQTYWLYNHFWIAIFGHFIKCYSNWGNIFSVSNLSIRSIYCCYNNFQHFLPSYSPKFFQSSDRRFYTAVKYQNYFKTKCSIFLIILHIFSCCSSVSNAW